MLGVSPGENEWSVTAFREHERHVWGVAYRMTGSASDADDVVQDTFARALERPPPVRDTPLRPWLTRVAMNVARDALRRRKRRSYVGPWLPSPVATADLEAGESVVSEEGEISGDAETRYARRESASFAFLVALEALTPQQRAVLLLRDVFDYSVRETAETLALSEPNVKTTHHRARRVMGAYDVTRRPPSTELVTTTRDALQRFLLLLVQEDAAGIEACLAEGVRAVTDGGGTYLAALRPVLGPDRVARFLVGLQRKTAWKGQFALRSFNGMPALVAELDGGSARWAPRMLLRLDLDDAGRIREVHVVLAPPKLTRVGALGETGET